MMNFKKILLSVIVVGILLLPVSAFAASNYKQSNNGPYCAQLYCDYYNNEVEGTAKAVSANPLAIDIDYISAEVKLYAAGWVYLGGAGHYVPNGHVAEANYTATSTASYAFTTGNYEFEDNQYGNWYPSLQTNNVYPD